MNLRLLTDKRLYIVNVRTARRERAITLKLLRQLNEIACRRMYSKYNCSSLHVYCVQELKMTDGDASRKCAAARLLREVPALEAKVLEGAIQMTSVSDIGKFFEKEAQAGERYSAPEKLELIAKLENKPTRKIQSILIAKSVKPEVHFRETVREVAPKMFEVKMYVTEEQLSDMENLRSTWSHAMPNGLLSNVCARAAKECYQKHHPLEKAKRAVKRHEAKNAFASNPSTTAPATSTSALKPDAEPTAGGESPIKSWVSHQVWLRDQGECTFKDPRTGERCSSQHFVEEDHIIAKAMGGKYTVDNMRLRCRAHNQRHAISTYGAAKMSQYLS